MARLSLDVLARVAIGLDVLGRDDLVVFHYPDGEWSLGTPGKERMSRIELCAMTKELLERRAADAQRALDVVDEAIAGENLSVPDPGAVDLEEVRRIASDALAKARGV